MLVSELPIPPSLKEVLAKSGYSELYPPQKEAVAAGVLEGRNVVLASPTASGKTLVAELCILKHIFEKGGRALYLTPLRALANEKYQDFRKYEALRKPNGEHIRVGISTGDLDSSDPWLGKFDIVLATNEKADSLLRHRAPWLQDVAVVVADEVHLLTEVERGPTLEVVLTRLKRMNPKIQFLALSATIRNTDEISEWIGASPITTEWRPVPLKEGVYVEGELQFKDGSSTRVSADSKNPLFDIALDVVEEGGQALIFAETRRSAVEIGKRASGLLKKKLGKNELTVLDGLAARILGSREKTRLSEALAEQVRGGAAFHHAGLAGVHRGIVEEAFRSGRLKILSATPTLAAGVNLPARRVILSSYNRYEPGFGRYPISVLEYKQMTGRAGRPRYDKFGESILLARNTDEQVFLMDKYVLADPEKIWSKLAVERVLRPHVLSTIATGFASSEQGLYDFFSETFYAHQYGPRLIKGKIGEILRFLVKEEMVKMEGEELAATKFGRRVSELYIDPVSAVIIRDGLYNRPPKTTELSFLHLISKTPDLSPKLHPRGKEDENLTLLAEDRKEEFMTSIPEPDKDPVEYDEFLSELKSAVVMLDWIQETSEDQILEARRVEPGDLLRLTDMGEWLLHASFELGRLFGHKDLLNEIELLRLRVSKGIRSELVKLVSLEGIGRVRARMLHNAGFKELKDLKAASVTELMAVPTIGPSLAKRIKDQVGGLIKAEEWEMLKEKTPVYEEQSALTDF